MENKYIDTLFKSVVIFYDNIINKIGNKKEIVSNYNMEKGIIGIVMVIIFRILIKLKELIINWEK